MLSYSRLADVFQPEALLAFDRAEMWVRRMPDRDQAGRWVRCHEVARAVHRLLVGHAYEGWVLVDGRYGPVMHSYLALRDHGTILDPYAVARVPPVQLVAGAFAANYQPGPTRADVRDEVVELLIRSVDTSVSVEL